MTDNAHDVLAGHTDNRWVRHARHVAWFFLASIVMAGLAGLATGEYLITAECSVLALAPGALLVFMPSGSRR